MFICDLYPTLSLQVNLPLNPSRSTFRSTPPVNLPLNSPGHLSAFSNRSITPSTIR